MWQSTTTDLGINGRLSRSNTVPFDALIDRNMLTINVYDEANQIKLKSWLFATNTFI